MSRPTVDWKALICDPVDRSPVAVWEPETVKFESGRSYPLVDGCPILIDESHSLFTIESIQHKQVTTQDSAKHRRFETKIRHRLPSLAPDRNQAARYRQLAQQLVDAPILILGAGDKSDYYRSIFGETRVVTTDVHAQYGVDVICDAQQIPFQDNAFGLVFAAQVFEHIANPWLAAQEVERVAKQNGFIQIETPFCFPYHGHEYDFHRFTPTALRFLFPNSRVTNFEVASGNGATAAVMFESFMINSTRQRRLRSAMLLLGRLGLWWLNYFDNLPDRTLPQQVMSAKGFAVTYCYDGVQRTQHELIKESRNYAF